jgi:NTP pyrophosphatase (non-canonical NTP hydrolase)
MTPPSHDCFDALRLRLAEFAAARDWDQFHTPKNLAMALAGEAGELLEQFQWLTPEQSQALSADKAKAVAHELADILIYLIRLADKLGVNLASTAWEKIAINETRYPPERVRGDARRAAEYDCEEKGAPEKGASSISP